LDPQASRGLAGGTTPASVLFGWDQLKRPVSAIEQKNFLGSKPEILKAKKPGIKPGFAFGKSS
jgi:hypothetical protein